MVGILHGLQMFPVPFVRFNPDYKKGQLHCALTHNTTPTSTSQ